MNTARLTSAELTALHIETFEAMRNDRMLASITRRALRLWEDGYTCSLLRTSCKRHLLNPGEWFQHDTYSVDTPSGGFYLVTLSDKPLHPAYGNHCTCPCFAKVQTCKHIQAVEFRLAEEEAQEAGYEQRENADTDPYAEY